MKTLSAMVLCALSFFWKNHPSPPNLRIILTHYCPCYFSLPPENIRKPKKVSHVVLKPCITRERGATWCPLLVPDSLTYTCTILNNSSSSCSENCKTKTKFSSKRWFIFCRIFFITSLRSLFRHELLTDRLQISIVVLS